MKIYVGPERKQFTVHEDLLCDRLAFFKAAFTGRFKEGRDKCMDMPEDDPAAFAALVSWVYSGSLECGCDSESQDSIINESEDELLWCSLWVLADKINCDSLANAAIHTLRNCLYYREHREQKICAKTIEFVYSNTMENSALRNVIVEEFVERYFTLSSTPELKAKLLEEMATVNKFGVQVLEMVEQHVKSEDCLYANFSGCFCHDPENPLQKIKKESRKTPGWDSD